ncbi:hypothetical protein PIB30_026368 [Stylosanthes scabra]|uniref:CCHC-type domain-containing protein n=1 Tax=Stylosanthes scabra TaxID=79078 RepID=A0ABU6Q9X4_9FABA|nr:hypothetical protein [Stylosanthes scabra]
MVLEEIRAQEERASVVAEESCDPIGLGDYVGDPIAVRTKRTGRGNAPVGSRGVKRRKCSVCGEIGHRRKRCTKDSTVVENGTQESLGTSNSLSQILRPHRGRLARISSKTVSESNIFGDCP